MPPENDYHRKLHDELIKIAATLTEAMGSLKKDADKNWKEHEVLRDRKAMWVALSVIMSGMGALLFLVLRSSL